MRRISIPLAVGVLLAATATPASAASVGGQCRLSQNWLVKGSGSWTGNTFTYGVLNSPGPLRSGGYPDGTVSEFFLWRGSDLKYSGAFHNRDREITTSYVYRTTAIPGSAGSNITDITMYAIAPSGAFCPIRLDRP